MLSAYSGASSSQGAAPVQPIAFPHPVHVQKLGINCVYCHFSADKSPDPGMPAVGTCMGCHTLIGPQRPKSDLGPQRTSAEIQKLQTYAATNKPIPWVRIHKVPEYVHFPHMRHVNVGVTCQSCHGQIQTMTRVYQASALNMGWCVNCHVNGYSPAEGLQAAGYPVSDSTLAMLQSAGPPSGASLHADTTGQQPMGARRKARYDCATCHY